MCIQWIALKTCGVDLNFSNDILFTGMYERYSLILKFVSTGDEGGWGGLEEEGGRV